MFAMLSKETETNCFLIQDQQKVEEKYLNFF